MVTATNGGGGRATRALRILLLLVMTLAAVEYLFGSYLETSPLKTYIYQPIYAYNSNATISTLKSKESSSPPLSSRPKGLPETVVSSTNTNLVNTTKNSLIRLISKLATNANIARVTNSSKPLKVNNTVENRTTVEKIESTTKEPELEKTKATTTLKPQVSSNTTIMPPFMTEETTLPLCPAEPPDLGPVNVNKSDMELSDVEKKYPEVRMGGHYRPQNCTPRHKVAIIVPYRPDLTYLETTIRKCIGPEERLSVTLRDREQHLAIFVNHMHPFLMKQQIEYGIFIVEQEGLSAFNRAKLFNVGVKESSRFMLGGWQCFVFHDVDLLPLDTRNMYTCPKQPRHMSPAIDTQNFKLPYEDLFGGVSAMTAEQFNKVNGFSNKYWGWGAEDDDMAVRLRKNHYHIARYKMSVARYTMLHHQKAHANPKRYQILWQAHKNYQNDGLSTLRYSLVNVVEHHLYTMITVNIDEVS